VVVSNLLGVAALIVGLVMLARSGWSAIAAAQVTYDGASVLVPWPSPVFADQVAVVSREGSAG
jgi:hypothetical protein